MIDYLALITALAGAGYCCVVGAGQVFGRLRKGLRKHLRRAVREEISSIPRDGKESNGEKIARLMRDHSGEWEVYEEALLVHKSGLQIWHWTDPSNVKIYQLPGDNCTNKIDIFTDAEKKLIWDTGERLKNLLINSKAKKTQARVAAALDGLQ